MRNDITSDLRDTFHRAAMLHAQTRFRDPAHWAAAREIGAARAEMIETLQSNYDRDYPARVEAARKDLLDRRTQARLDLPAPRAFGVQSSQGIEAAAKAAVARAHDADLDRAREAADRAMQALIDRVSQSTATAITRVFERASDAEAPTGPDRPSRSRD